MSEEKLRVRYVSGIMDSFFGKEGLITERYEDEHVVVLIVTFDDGTMVAAYPHNLVPLTVL